MAAGELNIVIDQGSTFVMTITLTTDGTTPIDITGYSARMQMRTSHGAAATALDLSTGGGEITLSDPTAGEYTVTVDDATTAALTPGSYVYDFESVDTGGAVTRIIEGSAVVSPEVTR